MTVEVANTGTTNTWQYFLNRVNELATAMTTKVVTTDSNTASGNAAISGAFTANVLIANTVSVSNSTSNITISVPNTTLVSNGNYYLNANGSWSLIAPIIVSNTITTTGTAPQDIDYYPMAGIGGAEFFLRIKDNNANSYQAAKVLSYHNGVNAFSTEYGSMVSNVTLGTFGISTNATHVILTVTPTSTNSTINISRVNF